VVLGKLYPSDSAETIEASWEQMRRVANRVVPLRNPLPAPSTSIAALLDGVIVLDEIQAGTGPLEWSPIPVDRVKTAGTLSAWLSLPWKSVDTVILPGFHTAAENSLKAPGANPGSELFMATTGLMATGTRTILLSRWRTGGHTAIELIREFVQELPFSTAAEAWQRAVQLVSISPIDPLHEPRIRRKQDAEPLNAEHPFFWAGYMLVDTGASPQRAEPLAEKPILKFEDKKKPDAKPADDKKPEEKQAEDKKPADNPLDPRPKPVEGNAAVGEMKTAK
jgi:hypothetical protein